MIKPIHAMIRAIVRFASCRRGSLSVEAVIVMPVLLFWYAGSFVLFDAFKSYNITVKASYTISDILTRQVDTIGPSYIDGLGKLFDDLTYSTTAPWIRVSSISWDINRRDYRLDWSYATHSKPPLVAGDIASLKPYLPKIGIGDTLVVVQTFMPYTPAFNVNFAARTWYNLVPTRPRYASYLPYDPNL